MLFFRRKKKKTPKATEIKPKAEMKEEGITKEEAGIISTIRIEERSNAPGVWDVSVVLINKTEHNVKVDVILNVLKGKIVEIPSNAKQIEDKKILFQGIKLPTNEKVELKGISLLSVERPKINVEFKGKIEQ